MSRRTFFHTMTLSGTALALSRTAAIIGGNSATQAAENDIKAIAVRAVAGAKAIAGAAQKKTISILIPGGSAGI